jgi:hypothetical protein
MANEILTVRLTERAVARADGLLRALRAKVTRLRPELLSAFALENDERPFARALLARHPRFWLYRTHQRRFAGDFVVVDMSDAIVESRAAWALDLKLGADVKVGGGGAGNAFVRLDAAILEIATRDGALAPSHRVVRVTGDGAALVEWLGAQA